jgi:signal transduction histidine kinase
LDLGTQPRSGKIPGRYPIAVVKWVVLHLPGMREEGMHKQTETDDTSSATVSSSRVRSRRRLRRELVPAVVVVLFFGAMFVPLLGSTGSIAELQHEVTQMRQAYNRAGMLTLQYRLAEYHRATAFGNLGNEDELPSLPNIDERLYAVARFFSELQVELEEIEYSLQVLQDVAPRPADGGWSPEEFTRWSATAYELDLQFNALLERLSEIETQRSRAYISMGFFGMLLGVVFLVLYLKQAFKLELMTADQQHGRQVALLSNKIQEDERRALARDLHDGTAQELAIARMAVDKIEDGATRTIIEGSLSRAIDEIRLLARRMRPMPESYDTPAEMIRELCAYFESRNRFRFEFDLDRRVRLTWEEDAVVHLYRIVQESLANIVRHADASLVHVTLKSLDTVSGHCELTIHDNGVGLHNAEDGFGTQGMRERAELLCARFSRYSPPEGGTIVQLEFPVELEHCW